MHSGLTHILSWNSMFLRKFIIKSCGNSSESMDPNVSGKLSWFTFRVIGALKLSYSGQDIKMCSTSMGHSHISHSGAGFLSKRCFLLKRHVPIRSLASIAGTWCCATST